MIFVFDDKDFATDLETLVSRQNKYDKPLIVLPTKKDVEFAKKKFLTGDKESKITFIDYPYFDSKKWLTDDDYDHIDIFRLDQVILRKACGISVGRATIKRVIAKKHKKEEA